MASGVFGVTAAILGFDAMTNDVTKALGVGIGKGVKAGEGIAKGHASKPKGGPPGPRVISGDFRAGIVGDWMIQGDTVLGQIGSNSPQAMRLEFGFMGMTDALGRTFHQPPYPWLLIGLPQIEKVLIDEARKAVQGSF